MTNYYNDPKICPLVFTVLYCFLASWPMLGHGITVTAGVITVEPVRRTYRAPRNPVPWLELASADGPWRSGLHASTVILGSIVLTDARVEVFSEIQEY
jgi:hypothetical protein